MAHAKPLHFIDLEDGDSLNPVVRKRFQSIFIIILQIFGAIIITVIVDYYLYKYESSQLSGFEVIGVAGGFISLLSKIECGLGNILLTSLNYIKITSPKLKSMQSDPKFASITL